MKIKSFLFLCISLLTSINVANTDIPINQLIERLNITPDDLHQRGVEEIASFVKSGVWKQGYYEGDPTNPNDKNSYHYLFLHNGKLLSPFYICYTECLKPFITSEKTVLEIGPGRGAWTKAIAQLNPKAIYCVDALSEYHNNFWNYVGRHNNVHYHQVIDFSLDCIQDDSINFVFSFGTFCQVGS